MDQMTLLQNAVMRASELRESKGGSGGPQVEAES